MAIGFKQEPAARWLLEHGAEPGLADSVRQTPLRMAALTGSVGLVRLLLERGVPLDVVDAVDGGTAFHAASVAGHAECVALLVEAGCDTSLLSMDGMTGTGMTGRQQAEHNGHTAVLAILDASGSPEPRLPPQQLPSGSTVEVYGLTGAPEGRPFVSLPQPKPSCRQQHPSWQEDDEDDQLWFDADPTEQARHDLLTRLLADLDG